MIVLEVEENAGIGNQMYQYAHAVALAKKYNQKILIISYLGRADDVREYMLDKLTLDANMIIGIIRVDWFNVLKNISWFPRKNMLNRIARKVISGIIRSLIRVGILEERAVKKQDNRQYIQDKPLQKGKSYYISGFYETYKYFDEYRDSIQKQFRLKEIPKDDAVQYYIDQAKRTNSVAVHIRRGDFAICGRLFPLEYYDNAMKYVETILGNPHFMILCEDEEVISHYEKQERKNIECIKTSLEKKDIVEWYLLSLCHHHIVTNSTYSWWSAYVSSAPDKQVFIPTRAEYLERENADIYLQQGVKYPVSHYDNFFPEDWKVLPARKCEG